MMAASGLDELIRAREWLAAGRKVALATVVSTWGSAPQPVGSTLLIDADGNFEGAVSGGCVEGEVIAEAVDIIASGRAKVLEYGVEDETAWRVGLACGGAIRVLVERVGDEQGLSEATLERLIAHMARREAVARIVDVETAASRVVSLEHAYDDLLVKQLEDAFRFDRSGLVEVEEGTFFIHVFNPAVRTIVIGAVAIAQHLAPMLERLGHDVIIIDPRQAFATTERFAGFHVIAAWPDEALADIAIDQRTAFAVLTHDPKIDDPALRIAVASDAFYIGALGSRRTHAKRLERLGKAGVGKDMLARIQAPIGLDIGARGSAEIALAVAGEIVKTLRGS